MLHLNSRPLHHDPFGYFPDDNWLLPRHPHYRPLFADRITNQMDEMAAHMNDGVSIVNDADKFAVCMDVAEYSPEEIHVNIAERDERDSPEPPELIVTAKHEEDHTDQQGDESHRTTKQQHTTRSFTRRYSLPPDVDEKHITCALSDRGVLTVNAPRVQLPALADSEKVHAIPIEHVPKEEPKHTDDHKQEKSVAQSFP